MIPKTRLMAKSRLIISNESNAKSVIKINVAKKETTVFFFEKKILTIEEISKLTKEIKTKIINQLSGETNKINAPVIKLKIITLASFIYFYYNLNL